MYYLINSEQEDITGFTSAYEATTALVIELERQRNNHRETTDTDMWFESTGSDWIDVVARAYVLYRRAQDGGHKLDKPAFFHLPNGEVVTLAEITQ